MKFLSFGTTMGDDQEARKIAAKHVLPEFLTGLGLRLAGIAVMGWGLINGIQTKRGVATVINTKTVSGVALYGISSVVAMDTMNRFEREVAANRAPTIASPPVAKKGVITLKPHA